MKNHRWEIIVIGFLLMSLCSCADQGDDDDNDDDDSTDDDDDYTLTEGFAFILSGKFLMGSDLEYSWADDEPQHQVTLTHDFEIMTTEATQEQYESLMDANPSYFNTCGGNCPVDSVSWYDALAFANLLSERESLKPCFIFSEVDCNLDDGYYTYLCPDGGRIRSAIVTLDSASTVYDCEGYRLPTEAEWEYAIRAGTNTDFYNGDITEFECYYLDPVLDDIAWYCGNADDFTRPVAQKAPNDWGLYDMSGNVKEWVWDRYTDTLIDEVNPWGGVPEYSDLVTVKGGGFLSGSRKCRSASRAKIGEGDYRIDKGFRLVRTLN
ncbi:MAG TPA: SUMF1/EgtB/PvdO family nonheme iron enzyme [bacterium]|nr:SUMF1/EgtB/PvdO family nonheme iron enzyme [bacterium]